ncbi:carbonic anhydrase [Brumimicrobium oceani]|nr:carbonic anhydrase [Brumimicrobium oceani]
MKKTNENKLFLICPDCFLENRIQHNFPGQSYFATALGAVFAPIKFGYAESINGIINRENIKEVYVVNDTSCRFINAIIQGEEGFNTKEEKILNDVFYENSVAILKHENIKDRAMELLQLNLTKQVKELRKTDLIGSKFQAGVLTIEGLIYDRKTLSFEMLHIKDNSHEPSM